MLYDALFEPAFTKLMVELLARRRSVGGSGGKLLGIPSPSLRQFDEFLTEDYTPVPLSAEQSNSSVLLGNSAIMKFIRRFEEGVNPGVEVGTLPERARPLPVRTAQRRKRGVPPRRAGLGSRPPWPCSRSSSRTRTTDGTTSSMP